MRRSCKPSDSPSVLARSRSLTFAAITSAERFTRSLAIDSKAEFFVRVEAIASEPLAFLASSIFFIALIDKA